MIVLTVSPKLTPPRKQQASRIRTFVAAVLRLWRGESELDFDRWYNRPCERCGGPRNWRVHGHYQAVCYRCGSPRPLPKSAAQLLVDAHARRN